MTARRQIRMGVAGLGRAFTLMLPTFLLDPRVQLVAACDPREEARAQYERDFNGPAFHDIDSLARHPDVEVVYVASPHQHHAEHVRVAASCGKHVLLEKPMALTLDECDAMISQCHAAGVQLIVGHCHSFDAPYLKAWQLIRDGEFGQVRMINALNYTDFLYRPRRPEELQTEAGGGVVFSQAAHQVDVVRLLAGSPVSRVRAVASAWDPERQTEGAYTALLWFENRAVASITYSGYGHFDSDEWCGWIGEMGVPKNVEDYGVARRRLSQVIDGAEEARLKNSSTYGGPTYIRPAATTGTLQHQHFGPVLVSCERADLRPMPDGVWVYADSTRLHVGLPSPGVPRFEVMDELTAAVADGQAPLHDGNWARATLEVCLALLQSSREQRDIVLHPTTAATA